MENILATLYLTGVFFTAFIFLFFYVNELIDRKRNRRKTAGNQPEQISEPVCDIVGKSKTAFPAPLIFEKNEPVMSEDLEVETVTAAETEPDIPSGDVEVKTTVPSVPDVDEPDRYANDGMDTGGDFSQGLTYTKPLPNDLIKSLLF